ncbi:MAG: site-specific integrase, partial [Mariprofundaceae bacterium]|nr:site-specific integrase [Mariprofundaceae bacterium]
MDGLANPASGIRKPRVNNQRDRRLLPGEEACLLKAAKGQGLRSAIILALETGMRRGELVDTRWDWVDLKRPVIALPDSKSGDPREVPLTLYAVKTLRELPRHIDGRVLGINNDQLTRGFRIACANAKDSQGESSPIKGLHFHDLRHEATSRLFEKGLNPMQVAAITGHKTLQMLKRYTHLQAEDLAKLLG